MSMRVSRRRSVCACDSVNRSCDSVNRTCDFVNRSCDSVSRSCLSVSRSSDSVSRSCDSVSRSCLPLSRSSDSVSRSCLPLSRSNDSVSRSCFSVSRSCAARISPNPRTLSICISIIILILSSCSRQVRREGKPALTISLTMRSNRSNLCSGVIVQQFKLNRYLETDNRCGSGIRQGLNLEREEPRNDKTQASNWAVRAQLSNQRNNARIPTSTR